MDISLPFVTSLACASSITAAIIWSVRRATEAPPKATRQPPTAPLIKVHIAPGARLLVTGATGFTSGWIIKQALEQGFKVRATVRKLGSGQDYLRKLEGADGNLELVECELESPASVWNNVVQGCEGVCHVASPMDFGSSDPQKQLVDPQLHATRCILEAAKKHNVKRVVVTSSTQAISTTTPDWATHEYDEFDFNSEASLDRFPYPYSKILQEELTINFSREHGLSVCTIVPYSICGPALPGSPVNPTQEKIFGAPLKGFSPVCIDYTLGIVDVRDVALAHLRALTVPGAHGRYVVWADVLTYQNFYKLLGEIRPDLRKNVPTFLLPSALNFLIVLYLRVTLGRGVSDIVQAGLGKQPRFNTKRTQADLGFQFRAAEETIRESVHALEEWKIIPLPKQAM